MSVVLRRLALANLFAQSAIIVTGVIVRVTGSGLGCPTWPQCVPGSFTPTVDQPEAWHKYVEFGNRLLTFVLAGIAIALLVAVWRSAVGRQPGMRLLAAIPFLGVVAQAVLGGISVLLQLSPVTVMAHFLLSVVLVAYSHRLWFVLGGFEQLSNVPAAILRSARMQRISGFAILTFGTVVSATGPHSGDAAADRLTFDPRVTTLIHAVIAMLYIVASVRLFMAAKYELQDARFTLIVRRTMELATATAISGVLQYLLAIPWYLVTLHAALSAGFWVASLHTHRVVTR